MTLNHFYFHCLLWTFDPSPCFSLTCDCGFVSFRTGPSFHCRAATQDFCRSSSKPVPFSGYENTINLRHRSCCDSPTFGKYNNIYNNPHTRLMFEARRWKYIYKTHDSSLLLYTVLYITIQYCILLCSTVYY